MDYKDLQINDWVYLSESTKYAMQVSLIDKYGCSLDFDDYTEVLLEFKEEE